MYKQENPVVEIKEEARESFGRTKKKQLIAASDKKLLTGAARDPIAKKVAMTDSKRLLEKFDRFNEDYVTAYIEDKQVRTVK